MTSRRIEVRPAGSTASQPVVGEVDAVLLFVVEGELGATSLEVSTGWFLPNSLTGVDGIDRDEFPEAGIGYHSAEPRGPGFEEFTGGCRLYTRCWGRGSTIAGRAVLRALLEQGDAGVWPELEALYSAAFERGSGPNQLEELKSRGRAVRYAP